MSATTERIDTTRLLAATLMEVADRFCRRDEVMAGYLRSAAGTIVHQADRIARLERLNVALAERVGTQAEALCRIAERRRPAADDPWVDLGGEGG